MKSSRLMLRLLCVLAFVGASNAWAASDWQVVKVGGWDYLTVDNIAKFYGFAGDVHPVNNAIHLDNGRNQLEVTLGSREAIVNGVRNWLCFPVLAHGDGKFLVSRIDLAKTIEPQFRPQMIPNLRALKTVVIDAGHGGIENGAASSYGREKDFTLDVAKQLKPLLEAKGLHVVMTRDRDEVVPLPLRAQIANATRDSIFVSIHFNATDTNSSASGFEIYSLTPRGAPSTQDNSMLQHFANMQAGSPVDAASLVLSTSVYHAMLGYMPEFDRGVKRARFAVLRLTNIPAILVEGGFLTEREESRYIATSQWRGKLAQAIAVGIDNYRGLVERRQRPMLLADYRRQIEGVLVARNATSGQPAVVAASNVISAPNAQITSPIHREPSEQMSVPPDPVASTPPEAAAASTPGDEEATEAASAAPSSEASPVEVADVQSVANESSSLPDITPPAPVPAAAVRKFWVLKLTPPPKF
ncbi:MAG: N-acetylmuramoyl-L-alanine amidase, partial [Verrucomicrobiota bacterium]|nr:N-acetylmuramoyl-L-alanine amidase [Verrucomicrobiota bacterium]